MSQQGMFTPESVYNLIAGSDQGRAFVENLARASQLQQAAKQYAPQIQQFAQNPMQAFNSMGQWAQNNVNQMQQQPVQQSAQVPQEQTQQAPVPQPQQTVGGQQPMDIMSMAMNIVGELKASIKEIQGALDTVHNVELDNSEKLEELKKDTSEKLEELKKDNKALLTELSTTRKELGKLTAKG